MDITEIKATIKLVEEHLKLWGEPNPSKRLSMAMDIYSPKVTVIDPGKILNGYEETKDFIGELLANNPGFAFRAIKPVEVHHNMALLSWSFGLPDKPDKITGQDIFTIHDGRISSLLIFLDGFTASILL